MSRPVFVVGLIAVCSFFLCHHRPQHRDSCAIRAYAQVRNAAVCSRLVRRAFNVASVMDTSAPAPNAAEMIPNVRGPASSVFFASARSTRR